MKSPLHPATSPDPLSPSRPIDSNLDSGIAAPNVAAPNTQTAPTSTTLPNARFDGIDGLRGLAALMIVVYHLYGSFNALQWRPVANFNVFRFIEDGWIGVNLFLVLSGFCLAYPFARRPDRLFNWGDFMTRRVRRIVPAYYASLVLIPALTLGLGALIHRDIFREPQGWGDIVLHLTFLHGLWWKTIHTINGVYWTLSLEWLWYLAFPFALWLYKTRGPRVAIAVLIGITVLYRVGLWQTYQPNPLLSSDDENDRILALRGSLPGLLSIFCLGISVAWALAQRVQPVTKKDVWRVSFLCVFLLCLGRLTAPVPNLLPVRDFAYGLAFSSLVWLVAVPTPNLWQKFFSWRPLVFAGTVSYSLYLYHLPFCKAIGGWAKDHHQATPAIFILTLIGLFPFLILISWALYQAFEKPFFMTSKNKVA